MIQTQAVWLQSLDSSTPRSIQTHRAKDYIPENRVHATAVAEENRGNHKYNPSTTHSSSNTLSSSLAASRTSQTEQRLHFLFFILYHKLNCSKKASLH